MPDLSPLRILLVDDRPENLLSLEAALAGLGQTTVRAASGREALRLLLDQDFAVILLDMEMPGMGGMETATLIRARPSTRHTPIIFLSAHPLGPEALARCYAAGAVDFLSKPLVPDILRAKVSVFVDLAQKNQALERAQQELRQRSALELRESEERFRLLVEGTRDYAIFMLDAQGCIVSWNLGGALLYGYTAEEAVGQHFSLLLREEEAALGVADEELRCALREGRYLGEGWRVRKDGTQFWGSVVVTPLYDADGSLRGFGKVVKDLTGQKAAEAALLETQALFRDFMNHSPALAFIRDCQNRLVFVNAAYERFFGAPLQDLRGKGLQDVVPADTAAALEALYQRVLVGGCPLQEDLAIPDPGGRLHDCRFHVFPITNAAGERLLGGFALDVSEQRHLEEQLRQSQKMEAVGQLAGGIAHDFNNMLAVINGYSELIQASASLNDDIRQRLAEIHRAGQRAASLTRQLLAFSRKQLLTPRLLDLNALVADVQKLLQRVIGEDIRLSTALHPGPCTVMIDPGQLEQVLLNLVVNARDAMPRGGCLTIETRPVHLGEDYASRHFEVVPGAYVMLAVTDTGCGMEKQLLERIFEPFFTTKDVGKGTGLGLATVHGIVKQSGGDIQVYSEPHVGTTFKVYLPQVDPGAATAPSGAPGASSLPGTETVLLVEDEEMVRRLIRSTLEMGGYRVLEARDTTDAIELCREHRTSIDLLLTDVVMPTMGGRELAGHMLGISPDLKVLFMSGYTDDTVVRHGILAAEVAFIQKPFSTSDLMRKVREVLDGTGSAAGATHPS